MRRLFEILIGISMLAGAIYAAKENVRYGRDGIHVPGIVVQVQNRIVFDERSWSCTQALVVEFTLRGTSEKRRFRSSIGTSASFALKTGTRLPVLYIENEPENARINSCAQWLLPLMLAGFGIAFAMGWTTGPRERRFGFRWKNDLKNGAVVSAEVRSLGSCICAVFGAITPSLRSASKLFIRRWLEDLR